MSDKGGSPRFSVCIRANRRREALQRAIRSALDQEDADLEVVVSDDSGRLEGVVAAAGDGGSISRAGALATPCSASLSAFSSRS